MSKTQEFKDNYRQKISEMDDDRLRGETYDMIYHSARCNNNPRSDWHWMVDMCYDECQSRSDTMYKEVFEECYADNVG